MGSFVLVHIGSGINLIRTSPNQPDANDLISNPDVWRDVYLANRDEVIAKCGRHCEAVKRFEPDLADEDEDEDEDEDSEDVPT